VQFHPSHQAEDRGARLRAVDAMLAEARAARAPTPVGRMLDWMFLMKGMATIGTSLLVGAIGPFAIRWSADMAAQTNAVLPALAVPFVERPWLIAALAAPSVACGVVLPATRRYRWVMLTISTLLLLTILVVILAVFTAGLSAAYRV
jgi:hypothetical protein